MSNEAPGAILISGGGTAGHVQPGIDIARALVAGGHPTSSIHYVGSERGLEARLVPEAGFDLTLLPGRGLQRRLTLANVGAAFGLLRAVGRAFAVMRRIRPVVVVSLGGYASVPCALWAVVLRIPIVVAEQNAVPGLANRLIGRFAAACATSFPDVDLPRAVWTGNPVRQEVLAVDRSSDRSMARERLGIEDDRQLVAAFGGSLGARRINRAMIEALPRWSARSDLAIRHIIGERDHAEIEEAVDLAPDAAVQYQAVRYEHDMPTVLAAADVLICRAGATTVAEVAVTGVPAILVPLPGAPGDHQTANATALVELGAAVLVPDDELDASRLITEVDALLTDPDRRADMASAAADFARPGAAGAVARLIDAHTADG